MPSNDIFDLAPYIWSFASKVMMSHSSNWFTLLILCISAPLVLCCDQFDRGSRQVKREPVDLIMEDYDITLCQQIKEHKDDILCKYQNMMHVSDDTWYRGNTWNSHVHNYEPCVSLDGHAAVATWKCDSSPTHQMYVGIKHSVCIWMKHFVSLYILISWWDLMYTLPEHQEQVFTLIHPHGISMCWVGLPD